MVHQQLIYVWLPTKVAGFPLTYIPSQWARAAAPFLEEIESYQYF